ncbi:MAG TPA: energy transducer TonB [Allosphingosinicella sp.]
MRAGSCAWTLAGTLIAASPAGAAEPAPTVAAFEAAMRAMDDRSAARIADSLASRHRLERREMLPDPLLNGLVGRLYLRRGLPLAALPYLRRSDSPDLPAAQRIAAGFALGEAEEAVGEWAAAAATFERLLSLPLDPGQQLGARLGLARARLADDPGAALATASALVPQAPAGRRWEAELVSAQALSLLGRRPEADLAAGRAWSDSAEAAAGQGAPMRVALVRAGLAAAAGRRQPLMAMLTVANAGINKMDSDVADAAPICGEGGITPADHATFGAYTRTDATQWLTPIAASRPAAAALFRKAIAGRPLLASTGTPPGGLVFTLRCRMLPSADYVPAAAADPWIQYHAERGLYFPMSGGAELEDINRLSDEIDALAARHGDDHLSIVPLRLTLLEKLILRASTQSDVAQSQVAALRRKIAAGLAKAGGAEAFLPDMNLVAEIERLDRAGSTAEATAAYRAGQEALITRLPPAQAYTALREWLGQDKDVPDAVRRRIIDALAARTPGGKADPVRRALFRRSGALARKAGDAAAANAAFAAAGIPGDSCSSAAAPPEARDHGMTDEDYPPDAIEPNIEGLTVLELDLGAEGRVAASRIILSAPSLVFDALVESKLPAFRYSPAVADRGRARACRATSQTIRWRMPEEDAPGPPAFASDPEIGT